MSMRPDSASSDSGVRRDRPPTLEEFAEELQRRIGPGQTVTIRYPEPKSDGPIKAKFFFANPLRKNP